LAGEKIILINKPINQSPNKKTIMKKITHVIEAQPNGTFDQIIWYKNKAGEKTSTREQINPPTDQVKKIMQNPLQFIYITN
jgi:hypothetical protein